MRIIRLCLLLALLPVSASCQVSAFEIFGNITGECHGKIYMFFEGNYRQRDSISSEIKDGKFYFNAHAPLPIQARFHLDQRSYIQDVFIDNDKTYITCSNKITVSPDGKDTTNILSVLSVKGSATDNIKRDVEKDIDNIKKSGKPQDEVAQGYYQRLAGFIAQYPLNKLSPYELSKATMLSWEQVKYLKSNIDSSLSGTFEMRQVNKLLNELDKAKNSVTGTAFHDVELQDTSGAKINTSHYRGKCTLVVCWASWCGPCRAEHPMLNNIYEKYKDKGLQMLGISFDKEKDKWIKAMVKDNLTWPQLVDLNAMEGDFARYYDIEAIPANFLLDKDGKIVATELSEKEIEEELDKLLP